MESMQYQHDWKPVKQRPGGDLVAFICKHCGKFEIDLRR